MKVYFGIAGLLLLVTALPVFAEDDNDAKCYAETKSFNFDSYLYYKNDVQPTVHHETDITASCKCNGKLFFDKLGPTKSVRRSSWKADLDKNPGLAYEGSEARVILKGGATKDEYRWFYARFIYFECKKDKDTWRVTADEPDVPVLDEFTPENSDYRGDHPQQTAGSPTTKVCGDPHFHRWNQVKKDSFHGGCDIVFLKSDAIDIHIRTTIENSFSYVEETAVRVGNHIVEFHREKVFFDGEQLHETDFPLSFGGKGYRIVKNMDDIHQYRVYADAGTYATVTNHHKLMKTEIAGNATNLGLSKGILGEFGTGQMIGRSGQIVNSFEEFGHEWQVHPEEDNQLFMNARAPQFPHELCHMPTESRTARRRRLRLGDQGNNELFEKASEACAVHGEDKDLCVEDVLVTGDLSLADFW